MEILTYPKAADFLAATADLLQSDEARYGLIYGIARLVAINAHHYGDEDPCFWIVSDSSDISAMAWRTPPYPVGLAWRTGDAEEAASLLISAIHNHWQEIPGVTGHSEVADPFAERWVQTYRTSIQSTMAQRIYRLDSVNSVPSVPGRIRLATMEDKGLVSVWVHAFNREALGELNLPVADITPRIQEGEVYLWESGGKPVSMVIKGRPSQHGMTIATVYTPLEIRKQGYATACVAAVCREILSSGYDFCTLYTDLSNPTSNSIYVKVGFEPVCDSVWHIFSVVEGDVS